MTFNAFNNVRVLKKSILQIFAINRVTNQKQNAVLGNKSQLKKKKTQKEWKVTLVDDEGCLNQYVVSNKNGVNCSNGCTVISFGINCCYKQQLKHNGLCHKLIWNE